MARISLTKSIVQIMIIHIQQHTIIFEYKSRIHVNCTSNWRNAKSRDNTGLKVTWQYGAVTWQYRVQSHVTIQGSKSRDNTGLKVTRQYRVQSHVTIQGSKSRDNTGLKVTRQYRAQSHVTIQGSKSRDNTGFKVTWQYRVQSHLTILYIAQLLVSRSYGLQWTREGRSQVCPDDGRIFSREARRANRNKFHSCFLVQE